MWLMKVKESQRFRNVLNGCHSDVPPANNYDSVCIVTQQNESQ